VTAGSWSREPRELSEPQRSLPDPSRELVPTSVPTFPGAVKRLGTPQNGQRIGTCRSRSSFKLVGSRPESGQIPDNVSKCPKLHFVDRLKLLLGTRCCRRGVERSSSSSPRPFCAGIAPASAAFWGRRSRPHRIDAARTATYPSCEPTSAGLSLSGSRTPSDACQDPARTHVCDSR
jgi:hypothetical protein